MKLSELWSRYLTSSGAQTQGEKSPLLREFLAAVHERDKLRAIQLATQLVQEGYYDEAIHAYKSLLEVFPEDQAFFENQIGRVYAKREEFDEALKFFIAARVHSFDPDVVDDEIFQICLAKCQKQPSASRKKMILNQYLILYPEGKHREEVKNLLEQMDKE